MFSFLFHMAVFFVLSLTSLSAEDPNITEKLYLKKFINNGKSVSFIRSKDGSGYIMRPGVGCIQAVLYKPSALSADIIYMGRFPGLKPQLIMTTPEGKTLYCEALDIRKSSPYVAPSSMR